MFFICTLVLRSAVPLCCQCMPKCTSFLSHDHSVPTLPDWLVSAKSAISSSVSVDVRMVNALFLEDY
uniref:Secreted protein n=1 Tax=Anguilla anguilla TaxID=7936 RepID=A0A0E9WVZ5_ANGAN